MAVRIRLSRFGRLHRPFFRIVAIDQRCHREGLANEVLGTYDPLAASNNIKVDVEKVQAWIGRGALLSTSLGNLFKHHGVALPAKAAPKRLARAKATAAKLAKADGKKFVAASRRAVRKHAAKVKAERKVKTDAEVAAAKAAKAAAAPAEAPKA